MGEDPRRARAIPARGERIRGRCAALGRCAARGCDPRHPDTAPTLHHLQRAAVSERPDLLVEARVDPLPHDARPPARRALALDSERRAGASRHGRLGPRPAAGGRRRDRSGSAHLVGGLPPPRQHRRRSGDRRGVRGHLRRLLLLRERRGQSDPRHQREYVRGFGGLRASAPRRSPSSALRPQGLRTCPGTSRTPSECTMC